MAFKRSGVRLPLAPPNFSCRDERNPTILWKLYLKGLKFSQNPGTSGGVMGITKDRGYWYFVKRVPKRFAHVDPR